MATEYSSASPEMPVTLQIDNGPEPKKKKKVKIHQCKKECWKRRHDILQVLLECKRESDSHHCMRMLPDLLETVPHRQSRTQHLFPALSIKNVQRNCRLQYQLPSQQLAISAVQSASDLLVQQGPSLRCFSCCVFLCCRQIGCHQGPGRVRSCVVVQV